MAIAIRLPKVTPSTQGVPEPKFFQAYETKILINLESCAAAGCSRSQFRERKNRRKVFPQCTQRLPRGSNRIPLGTCHFVPNAGLHFGHCRRSIAARYRVWLLHQGTLRNRDPTSIG